MRRAIDRDMFDELSTLISERLDGSIEAIASLRDQVVELEAIGKAVIGTLSRGGTIYTCGNGGSAAEALHLAEELLGRYRADRKPLAAVCLNADPTALTCIANDFGFDQVFARQCRALLGERDLLIIFSTSGNSTNLIEALHAAHEKGARTIALLGKSGGECAKHLSDTLIVASDDAAHIQEAHQVILHLICEMVERMTE